MAGTVLLCWEAGGGYGHAMALLAIGRRLKELGWRPVLAWPTHRMLRHLNFEEMTFHLMPRWGEGADPLERSTQSSASLGDILAQIGLQSVEWVELQIRHWHEVFAEYRPDVIVADYAPGAVLAARDRIPCVVCGVGFTVPPAGMREFPRLHNAAPVLYDESEICGAINLALAEFETSPIAFLPEALAGDAQCACTLPILDPYDGLRTEPVLGPRLDAPVKRRKPNAVEIFCYLREAPRANRLDEFASLLCDLPGRIVAFIPGLCEASAARLSRNGIIVLDTPAQLTSQLARSRMVIHFGGHGIASAALLSGTPQLILGFDIEKLLIAGSLERLGVAQRFDYYATSPETVTAAALTALEDSALPAKALEVARDYAQYRDCDVEAAIVATCLRLAQ